MIRTPVLLIAAAAAIVCGACADPTAPAPPTPATPTISEAFTALLTPGGTNVHPFDVAQIGGLKVTLTSMDPDVAVQISVGTPSSATGLCVAFQTVTVKAGSTPQLSGNATTSGKFCISVTDPGNLTDTGSYNITVLHS